MQRQEGLWIQGMNVTVLQRRVFRVCASKLASDESLGHQHMGAVYHRGRSQIVSTSESHGGGLDYIKNRIDASPATRWWRSCMRVTVCLSIDQGELLGGYSGVEAGGRKGRGSDDEYSGARLPKSKASVRNEVDSEEHHSAAEANLPIAKEGMKMQGNGYSTTQQQQRRAAGSQRGMLQLKQKIEDSAKCEKITDNNEAFTVASTRTSKE
ncbi:hypothetical protein B296_00034524 [Ensete ventricosum]|uniref:Uncharacterized protein n=1 Tax=Ensete ventricosum TaxID=4639 RepID=A0A426Y8L2_ENSVE|nr:hypothetical protein B296_00034524 [Ensete ventricosum]